MYSLPKDIFRPLLSHLIVAPPVYRCERCHYILKAKELTLQDKSDVGSRDDGYFLPLLNPIILVKTGIP